MNKILKILTFIAFFSFQATAQKKSDLYHFVDSLINFEAQTSVKLNQSPSKKTVKLSFKPIIFINGIEREKDNLNILTLDLVTDIDVWREASALLRFGDKGKEGVIDIYTIRSKNQFVKPFSVRYFDSQNVISTE